MKTRVVDRIPEWRFQAEVCARLAKLEESGRPFTFAADMNRGKRSRREQMEAKLTGIRAGEADLRLYLPGGRLLSLELKTPTGSRSKAQRERHPLLTGLGFDVRTIKAPTPEAMADAVEAIVREALA